MDTNSGHPKAFGVLASLKQEGEGYRLILDDLESMEKEGEWRKIFLFTWKDIPKDKFDELSFDDEELADFGRFVLIRLKALIHPAAPDVIDEEKVRWEKEILVDLIKEESTQRITLKLSEPIESNKKEDFLCLVSMKGLFKSDKRIYGFDAAQARSLSIDFICTVLQDYEVRALDGQPVSLRKLLT